MNEASLFIIYSEWDGWVCKYIEFFFILRNILFDDFLYTITLNRHTFAILPFKRLCVVAFEMLKLALFVFGGLTGEQFLQSLWCSYLPHRKLCYCFCACPVDRLLFGRFCYAGQVDVRDKTKHSK